MRENIFSHNKHCVCTIRDEYSMTNSPSLPTNYYGTTTLSCTRWVCVQFTTCVDKLVIVIK